MTSWTDALPGERTGVVSIPTIWLAFVLSLAIHIAVLWHWLPRLHLDPLKDVELGERSLVVRLAPPPSPPSAPPSPPPAQVLSVPRAERKIPKAAPAPPPAPPVIAMKEPAPARPAQAVPIPPPKPPAAAPAARQEGDLASYIEARRRERSQPAPDLPAAAIPNPDSVANAAPESENARATRQAKSNLAAGRPRTFGYDPSRGGGIFTIQHLGFDNAEFMFYGWNKDVERNTAQLIEVRRGSNSDIRIAVVRRMIAIIRDYEQTDFLWESKRLGRDLMLSARQKDNAELERFLLQEFFEDPRQPWR